MAGPGGQMCLPCEGCKDPECYREKLDAIQRHLRASQQEMAIQKVRFIEIMKGEQQLKRAGQLLLTMTSQIQELVDAIEIALEDAHQP